MMTKPTCQSIAAASETAKLAREAADDHAADRADVGLRERLRAEGDLLDLLRGGEGGSYVLRIEAAPGRSTVELVDWFTGTRRQRIGRGASFPEAYRAALAEAS